MMNRKIIPKLLLPLLLIVLAALTVVGADNQQAGFNDLSGKKRKIIEVWAKRNSSTEVEKKHHISLTASISLR